MGTFAVAYFNIKTWLKEASNRVEVVAFVNDAVTMIPGESEMFQGQGLFSSGAGNDHR